MTSPSRSCKAIIRIPKKCYTFIMACLSQARPAINKNVLTSDQVGGTVATATTTAAALAPAAGGGSEPDGYNRCEVLVAAAAKGVMDCVLTSPAEPESRQISRQTIPSSPGTRRSS